MNTYKNTDLIRLYKSNLVHISYINEYRNDPFSYTQLGQTVHTCLKEQSDLGLHCLLFHLHHLKVPQHGKISKFIFELRHENTAFYICENKAADQLCGHRTADQRLCFRYIDNAIPLLSESEISSL